MKSMSERLCFKCGKAGHSARFCKNNAAPGSLKAVTGGGPARVDIFQPPFEVSEGKKVDVNGFTVVTNGNRNPRGYNMGDAIAVAVARRNSFSALSEPDVQCPESGVNSSHDSPNYEPNTSACVVQVEAE